MGGHHQPDLDRVGPGEDHRGAVRQIWLRVRVPPARAGAVGRRTGGDAEELTDNGGALLRRLALAVDGLGQTLSEHSMVVHPGEPEIGEREPTESVDGLIW